MELIPILIYFKKLQWKQMLIIIVYLFSLKVKQRKKAGMEM